MINKKTILITGGAGFIGYHLIEKLIFTQLYNIVIVDNLNNYYDVQLKKDRLKTLRKIIYYLDNSGDKYFHFIKADILNKNKLEEIFKEYKFDYVVTLSAEAGVRYSSEHPEKFISTNIVGFWNILECCKKYKPLNLVYASSSSVYGNISEKPSEETDNTDFPVSLYGASKKSNEILAHAYYKFFDIPMTGLRFNTCFGSMGRPDMFFGLLGDALLNNKTIKVFNYGNMRRDFINVEDLCDGIYSAMINPHPYEIYNLGTGKVIELKYLIELFEKEFGKKVKKKYLSAPKGDVLLSYANIDKAKKELHYNPRISIEEGVKKYCDWYKMYYGKKG
ncbi:MAG: GDP-mannose 4,6-dehydratase [Candidatus Nanoarchaeia archaeon]|nr:GDP-mannose 4,6-dehydratase [Candidatus Nanoarchaeia archaeon]